MGQCLKVVVTYYEIKTTTYEQSEQLLTPQCSTNQSNMSYS